MPKVSNFLFVLLVVTCVIFLCGCDSASSNGGGGNASETSITISGKVYERISATPYSLSGPFTTTTPDATVVFLTSTTTSSNDGTYSISGVSSGYKTIFATKEGYIPTKVLTKISGSTLNIHLGLYPVTTVTPGRLDIKGIINWDAGGQINKYYYPNGMFQTTFANIKDNSGANIVAFNDPAFVNSFSTTEGTVIMSSESWESGWRMLSASEYAPIIKDAHDKGFKYMMMLGVIGHNTYDDEIYAFSNAYSGSSDDITFWNSWFASYEAIVVQYATIAKTCSAEYLSLGLGMGYASQLPVHYWSEIVYKITAEAGYTGELVFFGYTNPDMPFYESENYNKKGGGAPPAFVNLFDYIGVNIYNPLTGSTSTLSREGIKAGLSDILNWTSSFSKVIVMLGTPSTTTGASDGTYIEPCQYPLHIADSYTADNYQQADTYQALFEAINDPSYTNFANVKGVMSWGYNFKDDFDDPDFYGGLAMDKSGNIRGKPAESVCKWWFDRL